MATASGTLQQQPGSGHPRFPSRLTLGVIGLVIILLAGLAYASHRAGSYYTISPGTAPRITTSTSCEARPVSYALPDGSPCVLVHVGSGRAHALTGRLMMVDVSLGPTTTEEFLLDKVGLLGRYATGAELLPAPEVLGTTPASQYTQLNNQMMATSTEVAVVVALRRLGYKVTVVDHGVSVTEVLAGSAADKHLQVGDLVTKVNSSPVKSVEAFAAAVQVEHPGQILTIAVERGGHQMTMTIKLGVAPSGHGVTGRGFLGVGLSTDGTYRLPFPARIIAGDIGGPSAGLAFTLAMIDTLGTGRLIGSHAVAATGTISIDGSVGPVGGVAQKALAVRKAGAQLFLVPESEYRDAVTTAGPHMKVVGVVSVSQALAAIRHFLHQ